MMSRPPYKNLMRTCGGPVRELRRPAIDDGTLTYLSHVTATIGRSSNPKEQAATSWKVKSAARFRVIRNALREMASGRARCMYCEDSLGTDIDHFKPKALYPNAAFTWENYLLACSYCNSNQKREAFPVDQRGGALLIDPSTEDPLKHIALLPHLGEFAARSNRGAASIEVFGLNRPELIKGRLDAWVTLDTLLRRQADLKRTGNRRAAQLVSETIGNSAFSTVLEVMQVYAQAGLDLLTDDLREAIALHQQEAERSRQEDSA